MTDDEKLAISTAQVERQVQACYSTWADTYFEDYYGPKAAYPALQTTLVREQLAAANVKRVIDAGCGPASMIRTLGGLELDLYGFDLTAEMVDEARRVAKSLNIPEGHIWQGSVLDQASYLGAGKADFDAAICCGVMPHIRESDDAVILERVRESVRPGGLVLLEARNQLFGLFTLNRYSRDFFVQELIRPETLKDADRTSIDAALGELDQRFRMDLPPVRTGRDGKPGYDEVLSRTHNPLVLREQMSSAGFRDIEVLFYHFHALPPMLQKHMPEAFLSNSLALENPRDWRGYFMASAFMLAGRRS